MVGRVRDSSGGLAFLFEDVEVDVVFEVNVGVIDYRFIFYFGGVMRVILVYLVLGKERGGG